MWGGGVPGAAASFCTPVLSCLRSFFVCLLSLHTPLLSPLLLNSLPRPGRSNTSIHESMVAYYVPRDRSLGADQWAAMQRDL